MLFVTDFADQAVILPVVAGIACYLAVQGWRRGALAWILAVCTTFAAMLLLKLTFFACGSVVGAPDIRSPSGHTAAAALVAGGIAALYFPAWRKILLIAASAAGVIGVSRIVLNMHSVAEVMLGLGVGLGGTALLVRLAGPVPALDRGRMAALVVMIVTLFHGLHLPAEAAIRSTAFRAALLLNVCEPEPAALNAAPERKVQTETIDTAQPGKSFRSPVATVRTHEPVSGFHQPA